MRSQSRRLFFSSRRRHTRSYGDWSSDVCSSDLNGGPVAHAERIKTFLALHGLDPAERRTLTIGFASGRFPFINIPYGIVPRNPVEAAAWPVVKNKIFEEATEIFLRLLNGETLNSSMIAPRALRRSDFRSEDDWQRVLEAYGQYVDEVPLAPRWT